MKWDCPNGDECQYRHCLPKDYILKTKADKLQEDMTMEEFTNMEEQIDEERNRISKTGRPVSEQNYADWRKARDEQRLKIRSEKDRILAGKTTGIQLFKNSGNDIKDDEGAEDYVKEEEDGVDEDLEKDVFYKYTGKDDGK
jgi:hypothetical protein